jgi:hypothetical protein
LALAGTVTTGLEADPGAFTTCDGRGTRRISGTYRGSVAVAAASSFGASRGRALTSKANNEMIQQKIKTFI